MTSEHYPHKVVAVYPDEHTANVAVKALDAAALDDVRVIRLAQGISDIDQATEPGTGLTRDAATGAAAGTAVGAAAALTPALFVSAPAVSSLVVLGYGAVIGATAGAIHGLRLRENILSGLLKDSIKAGCHVVMLHASSDEARQQAGAVISATLPGQTAHT